MFKTEIVKKAEEADQVLTTLGITDKGVRAAIAMELLGQKYDLMEKHSKATFLKQHNPVLQDLRQLLIEEGVLTQGAQK